MHFICTLYGMHVAFISMPNPMANWTQDETRRETTWRRCLQEVMEHVSHDTEMKSRKAEHDNAEEGCTTHVWISFHYGHMAFCCGGRLMSLVVMTTIHNKSIDLYLYRAVRIGFHERTATCLNGNGLADRYRLHWNTVCANMGWYPWLHWNQWCL